MLAWVGLARSCRVTSKGVTVGWLPSMLENVEQAAGRSKALAASLLLLLPLPQRPPAWQPGLLAAKERVGLLPGGWGCCRDVAGALRSVRGVLSCSRAVTKCWSGVLGMEAATASLGCRTGRLKGEQGGGKEGEPEGEEAGGELGQARLGSVAEPSFSSLGWWGLWDG